MTKVSCLIFVIICFTSFCSAAQDIIKVEIQDSETLEPLSFATVRFKGTKRGLVADYNGQFRLPFKLIDDLPILVITYLGYSNTEVDAKSLSKTEVNIIKLVVQNELLEEVVINATKKDKTTYSNLSRLLQLHEDILAEDIVTKAVYAIRFNLDEKPHSHIGYYRDYQIVNNKYYNLNEGILEQFDNGINSSKTTDSLNQSVAYSFSKNTEFKRDTQYAVPYNGQTKFVQNAKMLSYGGNELTLLNVHDAIRNYKINSYSFVHKMTKDFLQNHEFVKGKIIVNADEPIIEISLKSKSSEVRCLYAAKGIILISLKDYAIHSFSYSVYDSNKFSPLFSMDTEYRRQDKKMYLNYITFNNRFVIADRDIFKDSLVTYNNKKNSFNITFTNRFKQETVHKRDFRIRYKGKRVSIEKMEITSEMAVRLEMEAFDEQLELLNSDKVAHLEIKIKNITDIDNRKIYKPNKKIAYQFREYFVQEVNPDKNLNKSLKYIPKFQPLEDAPLNSNDSISGYIINTPLMDRRMKKID